MGTRLTTNLLQKLQTDPRASRHLMPIPRLIIYRYTYMYIATAECVYDSVHMYALYVYMYTSSTLNPYPPPVTKCCKTHHSLLTVAMSPDSRWTKRALCEGMWRAVMATVWPAWRREWEKME